MVKDHVGRLEAFGLDSRNIANRAISSLAVELTGVRAALVELRSAMTLEQSARAAQDARLLRFIGALVVAMVVLLVILLVVLINAYIRSQLAALPR